MSILENERPERADLSNWLTDPFNKWAFWNIREIIPVADIANAPGNLLPLPAELRPLDGFKLPLPNGASMDLQTFLRFTATDGMVVLHDGKVVFEFYANGTNGQTPHILMSATKAVVGIVAGILARNGDLAIDALVSDYVPGIENTAYQGATIRHLLDMRTGVTLDEGQQRAYDLASNWVPVAAGEARPSFRAFFGSLAPSHDPHGGPFRYVSANTDLLGLAMEQATGQKFAELVSELLWRQMGAAHGAYVTLDNAGAARCTGGLCATVPDLARIGQLMLDEGRHGGIDIIPAAWIRDIAENGDRNAWRDGEWGTSFAPISPHMSYRSGWYSIHENPQILFAMGVHGQNLFIDRANRIVIAKLSSQGSRIDYAALGLTHQAVPEIRRCLAAGLGKKGWGSAPNPAGVAPRCA